MSRELGLHTVASYWVCFLFLHWSGQLDGALVIEVIIFECSTQTNTRAYLQA